MICVEPCEFDDVIESTPAMVVNWRSSGVATAEAIVAGSAPGSPALMVMVGKSTLGKIADRQSVIRHQAENGDAEHQQAGRNRPLNKGAGKIHVLPPPDLLRWFSASSASPAARAHGPLRLTNLHSSARHQTQGALGYNCFAGLHALLDHRLFPDPLAGHHVADVHSLIWFHDVNERAVLSGLDGLIRHQDGVRPFLPDRKVTRTNWPGQRVRFVFGNVALSLIVPVV